MAAVNQDFVTYQGDVVKPIFLVQDANSNPVDISSATQISWYAQRNLSDAIALTKTKTGGGIAFTNTGTDGKFTLTLLAADTSLLSDWYMHYASVTDSSGNVTTVSVGRMMVGLKPNWTWAPNLVGTESLYTVRQLVGDTVQSDQLLSDQQVNWAIGQYSNEWLAAAECCRNIAANFARQVDIGEGPMKKNYSQRMKAFKSMAIDLEQRGMARGGAVAYVGGVSISDKINQAQNTDRVPPSFVIAWADNLLPEAPVGHQTNANLGEPQDFGAVTGLVP